MSFRLQLALSALLGLPLAGCAHHKPAESAVEVHGQMLTEGTELAGEPGEDHEHMHQHMHGKMQGKMHGCDMHQKMQGGASEDGSACGCPCCGGSCAMHGRKGE